MSDLADPEERSNVDVAGRKAALRSDMRRVRRALPNQPARSARLWSHVRDLPAVRAARTIMVFDSIPGEPETLAFIEWCRGVGKAVLVPEDDPPPDPARIDVVILPGVAFTRDGHRLGQGGGWYDRFLAAVPVDCPMIGVAFDEQVVDALPIEPHDVVLDVVVTDTGPIFNAS